ncbi:MAG: MBL fold metallo-hydrolase, partial [Selenomonadaceae bacterium]|nr:MBL fold metallo-hydrolase [Selenomonadaceae bacterium]
MKTKVEILQGHQIGGCITIISTEQTKLVIDFGESLPGTDNVSNVDFDWQNENVSGVFFTHYHGDHIGRMEEIPEDIPIYMGEITFEVMLNIYQALSRHDDNMAKKAEWLRNRKNVFFIQPDKEERIGDMIVTPYSVDHSAFDSYMFLVHAYDEYILHTGDYRDHGHRGYVKGRNIPLAVIQKYITRYGRRKINMLITEGTTLTRSGLSRYTEKDMLHDADVFFQENK